MRSTKSQVIPLYTRAYFSPLFVFSVNFRSFKVVKSSNAIFVDARAPIPKSSRQNESLICGKICEKNNVTQIYKREREREPAPNEANDFHLDIYCPDGDFE